MSTIERPTMNRPGNLGQTLNDDASRLDAAAKVTGGAKFSRDRYELEGLLFAGFVRSPYGSAVLESHDIEAARAVPGVLGVELSGKDAEYQGQPVASVVAESKTALRRAIRALSPRWRMRESVSRVEEAAGEAPMTEPGFEKVLGESELVLDAVYSTPVQTHSPLETHGGVVHHMGESAVAYISTQGVQAAADGLDRELDLERADIDVRCEHIGGGFGSKLNGVGKEGALAAQTSAKYKRPVMVFTERDEDHLDTGNRPSLLARVRLAYGRDGMITGGHIHTWGGVGVAAGGGGAGVPSGHYAFGNLQRTHEDVRMNTGAPRPFRAPGRPQGSFVEELLIDEIAFDSGQDPVELRLRLTEDADFRAMLREGAERIGWDRRTLSVEQSGPVKRGFGCGTSSWGRYPAYAGAEVAVHRDGSVEARTGTQDIGTGMRTVAAVLASHHLGVPIDVVRVAIGRSGLPPGPGSGGSMTSHNVAPALKDAAEDAKRRVLEAVAERTGRRADALDIFGGEVLELGEPVMDWREACKLLPGDTVVGRGEWSGQRGPSERVGEGHSKGAQFVELTVDTETGLVRVERVVAIQSCGLVVCRKTAESQIIGAVTQGLSYALFEEKLMDRATGSMVNPNLEMYKVIGAGDMPHIEPVLWLKEQTGVRSLGEPPTIPTAGATACAVFNAIGAPVRSLPITPDKVLAAIEGGGS